MNSLLERVQDPIFQGFRKTAISPSIWDQLAGLNYNPHRMLETLQTSSKIHRLTVNDFPLIPRGYSRTILHRDSTGFEVVAIRWDAGAATPIHGHPGFSMVYLIEGLLHETGYRQDQGSLYKTSIIDYSAGDYSYHIGQFGRYDNAIHEITAECGSLSLHLYSDDAVKGEFFPAQMEE